MESAANGFQNNKLIAYVLAMPHQTIVLMSYVTILIVLYQLTNMVIACILMEVDGVVSVLVLQGMLQLPL